MPVNRQLNENEENRPQPLRIDEKDDFSLDLSAFELGVPEIDEQHFKLIELLQELIKVKLV